MTLQEILRAKGFKVHTARPTHALDEVVQMLVKFNCGSLVVCEQDDCAQVLGIITERDILRAVAGRTEPLSQIRVQDVMSRHLITGAPTDSLEHIMGVMTNRRIRHLPILEQGALRGIISIGDIVKAQHDQLTMENHYLKTYIHGEGETMASAPPR